MVPRIESEGPRVREFIGSFCKHTKGDLAGSPIELRAFQQQIIDGIFAIDPITGLWQHRTSLVMLPRKCGKSQLASGIALYALFASGEIGAEIYCVAAAKDQAKIVFDTAKQMVRMDSDLTAACEIRRDSIYVPASNSVLRVLSSDAGLQHGLNPYLAIVDETWAHPNGELTEALATGQGARRQAMVIHITTPGSGAESYLHSLVQHGKRVASGEVDDPSFYMWWNPPREKVDHTDPAVWREYHPALGDWIDESFLESQVKITPESEFRRLHLAEWTASREAWLPYGAWASCVDPTMEIQPEDRIVLGVDGSFSNDSTGVVAATRDGRIKVLGHWEKPLDDPQWRVPIGDVKERIRQACDLYQVQEIACDPFWIQQMVYELAEEGLPVVEYRTNNVSLIAPACKRFYDAVLDRKLSHDGHAPLARHIDNCRIKSDRFGVRIVKEEKDSPLKIDLAVCAVVALDRAQQLADPIVPRWAIY